MFLRSYGASARAQDVCLAYAQLAVSAAESQSYAAAEQVPYPASPHLCVLTACRLQSSICIFSPPTAVSMVEGGTGWHHNLQF